MYNILLNNLSTLNSRTKRRFYRLNVEEAGEGLDQGWEFEGVYTNEPVTHALLRKFSNASDGKAEDEKLDLIYSLTTKKVLEDPVHLEGEAPDIVADYLNCSKDTLLKMTHYEFYKALVRKMTAEEFLLEGEEVSSRLPAFEHQKIPNVPDGRDVMSAVLEMAVTITDIYQKHDNQCRLYLDYTGGDRMAAVIMIALTKMLEEWDIHVDHIWAVNFDETAHYNVIREKMEVNYVFDFISGLNEFSQYGRANILNQYLKKSEESGLLHLTDEAREVQAAISSLADAIQLCRSADIVSRIGKLVKAVKNYEEADLPPEPVIDFLIRDIRKNYQGLFEKSGRTITNIIRWCLDKSLIQQAVTMFSDLLPKQLVDKHVIYFDDMKWKDVIEDQKKTRDPDEYTFINKYIYEYLGYEYLGHLQQIPRAEYERIERKVQQAVKAIYSNNREIDAQVNSLITPNQLQNLLLNYMIFKNKVRHKLNHAAVSSINVRKLHKHMHWLDDSIFSEAESRESNPDITVELLTNMMYDLLDQIAELPGM